MIMPTNAATGLDDRYNDDGASVINTRVAAQACACHSSYGEIA